VSITVVGSVALDTVETPFGRNEEGLGGAATFFSLVSSQYTRTHLVGVIGEDFPEEHVQLLGSKDIDLDGLERAEGKTFRWVGKYHEDINERDSLHTALNVFEHFHPKLPDAAKSAQYLFLANIHPALQMEVLENSSAKFVGMDTMNLWIDIALDDLKAVLRKVDVLVINDAEAKQLTDTKNVIQAAHDIKGLGPKYVVVKKGEHGCLLFSPDGVFSAPAYPLSEVVDPTGAGDSFAGGFMGHIAEQDSTDAETLRQAVIHGSVTASFCCERFGPERTAEITRADIDARYGDFRALTTF
jgi:sugar/nucleoside kinase (ribokinase family)